MEKSLAHTTGVAVERSYAHGDLMAKRRKLMERVGGKIKNFQVGDQIIVDTTRRRLDGNGRAECPAPPEMSLFPTDIARGAL